MSVRRLAVAYLLLLALPLAAATAAVLDAWSGYRRLLRDAADARAAEMAVALLRLQLDDAGRTLAPEARPLAGADTGLAAVRTALRGDTVAELAEAGGRPAVTVHLSRDGGVAGVTAALEPRLLRTMEAIAGYEAALYRGRRRLAATDFGFGPGTLPARVATAVTAEDRTLILTLRDGVRAAVAPVRDADEWEVTGAVVAAPSRARGPLLPRRTLALALAGALLLGAAGWRLAGRVAARPAQGLRRLGRAAALVGLFALGPAAGVLWLDAALLRDADAATAQRLARAAAVARAESETRAGPTLARLTGEQVTLLESGEPVFTTLADTALARRLAGRPPPVPGFTEHGRVATHVGAIAYTATRLPDGRILFLSATPLRVQVAGFRFRGALAAAGIAVLAAIFYSLAGLGRSPLRFREAATAWSFLAPSLLHLLLFSAGPVLFALYLSLHRWNIVEAARPFVGLANYGRLLGDRDFWNAVKNTAVFTLYVPATMALALAAALALNRRAPGVRLLRTVFFLPHVTSFVAIAIVWEWMYHPDFGILNYALDLAALPKLPWLVSPRTALPALMLMAVWMTVGYQMVVFLAGLQAIPRELYESAVLDGASAWQRFRRITFPLLWPTTFFILVTSVIWSFQIFTAVYVMTEGGPLGSTDVIVYHIYRTAWQYLEMGYASAMSWVLFAILMAVTWLQFRYLGRRVEYW